MIRASLRPTAVLLDSHMCWHLCHHASGKVLQLVSLAFLLCFLGYALISIAETLPKSEDFSLLVTLVEFSVLLD